MADQSPSPTVDSDLQTVVVPDVGEGVAEVEIVDWLMAVGDSVDRNGAVVELMTDKATVEVPAPFAGELVEVAAAVGDTITVGSPLFVMRVGSGESRPELAPAATDAATATQTPPETEPSANGHRAPIEQAGPDTGQAANQWFGGPARSTKPDKPKATPALRRRAKDLGVDLREVDPTGPNQRVTHDDLDRFIASRQGGRTSATVAAAPPQARTGSSEQKVVGLRRKISQQMVAATSTIPHITYVDEIDVTALEDLRKQLNDENQHRPEVPRLTLLPFLIRAMVNAIVDHPHLNSHLIDGDPDGGPDVLKTFEAVHVGIATQTDNGLIVPVVRHAEAHTVWSAASSLAEVTAATRAGTALAAELSGSTITVTSLGALGGIVTTPVINKPEVAIVGVNKIVTRPVWVDGEFVPRKIMNLSSSFDHRVVDGWDAAQFVQAIRRQLEQPALLFIDPIV